MRRWICQLFGHRWEKDERNRYGTALASRPIEECRWCGEERWS